MRLCIVLVGQALRSPDVDSHLHPVPVLLGAAVATVVTAVALRVAALDEAFGEL